MRRSGFIALAALAALFVACGVGTSGDAPADGPGSSDDGTSPPEGGTDSGSPTKPGADGGHHDASAEAGDDAGVDASKPLGGCTTVGPLTFRTQDAEILTLNDGTEVRKLSAPIPGFGQLALFLYRGAAGGFVAGTWSLACTPGAPCPSGTVYSAADGQEYGPIAGTVTVSTLASPTSNEMTGSLTGFEFRHLVQIPTDGGYFYAVDPAGACVKLADSTFDTRTPVGTPCLHHVECGTTKVCSIASKTCVDSECTPAGGCPGAQICDDDGFGARYCATTCDLFTPCANGYACDRGLCRHEGPSGLGASCTPNQDVVTGCQSGLYCQTALDPVKLAWVSTCIQACNPFVVAPGCAASERCLAEDYCGAPLDPLHVVPGTFDQPCSLPPGASSASCVDDGKAYRGVCYTEDLMFGEKQTICRRLCDPKGPACPAGQSCMNTPAAGFAGSTYACR